MAKLDLITSHNKLIWMNKMAWDSYYGQGERPPVPPAPPISTPCLMKLLITPHPGSNRAHMLSVTCSKNEAKRLVYPKTNLHRSSGNFSLCYGDLRTEVNNFIVRILGHTYGVDGGHPEQRRLTDRALAEAGSGKGSVLITHRVYNSIREPDIRLVNFYIVDTRDARKLVYHKKKLTKKISISWDDVRASGDSVGSGSTGTTAYHMHKPPVDWFRE